MILNGDTTFLSLDSSIVQINRGNETILIVNDNKTEKSKVETDWNTSLWIPLFIVLIGATISYLINNRKTKSEIRKLDLGSDKIDVEIDKIKEERKKLTIEKTKIENEVSKMKVETIMMRNSFQPYVLSTIQSVQEKLIEDKVKALKALIQVKNTFMKHKQFLIEGDPAEPEEEKLLELLFKEFTHIKYTSFKDFYNEYSYLFSKKTFEYIQSLNQQIEKLNTWTDSYHYHNEGLNEDDGFYVGKDEKNLVKNILKGFDESLLSIRQDLHLDNTFVHDFIQSNQIANND